MSQNQIEKRQQVGRAIGGKDKWSKAFYEWYHRKSVLIIRTI
jgi:hypothetical protein